MSQATPYIPEVRGPELRRLPTLPEAGRQLVRQVNRARASATFDGSGVASVTFGPPPVGGYWLVQRVVVYATAGAPACFVYAGRALAENLIDGTASGSFDVADNNQPAMIAGGDELLIQWTGGTPGAAAVATVQYESVSASE